ncbi:hypothetical protein N7528_000092 [Penicillium herquei]|nr:hypothetical protein N7528_000092 [Penicillium herquei]
MPLQGEGKALLGNEALHTTISKIRKITGAPSISCGVLHHGEVIFTHAEGVANIEDNTPSDDQTIYPVASNTKAFIAAVCGILVDEGLLSWTDPVSKYLPEFKTMHDTEIGKRATILDLCSHGTGLAPLDCVGVGFFDEFLNPGSTGLKKASNLPVAYDFRTYWLSIIFFWMCAEYEEDKNFARGYSILDDGSPLLNGSLGLEDGEIQGASGYVRSTVQDMLKWANAVMEAEENEGSVDEKILAELSFENPLRQMGMIRCAHRPIILGTEGYENSYGLGWFRHMLPSQYLASIGPKFSLLPEPPVINQKGPPQLTIAHWGSFGGCLSAFYTFPAARSAIIVMANCNGAKGDPTDLIAQALCQDLFKMQPHINLEEFALQASSNAKIAWENLVEDWVRKRVQNTEHGPVDEYTGTYINKNLEITIKVSKIPQTDIKSEVNPELLAFNVNSLPRQTARLRHYHYDTWTFIPNSRDDATKKGMDGFLNLPWLLLVFARDEMGIISHLEWDLQGGSCEGPAPNLDANVAPVRFSKVATFEGSRT